MSTGDVSLNCPSHLEMKLFWTSFSSWIRSGFHSGGLRLINGSHGLEAFSEVCSLGIQLKGRFNGAFPNI